MKKIIYILIACVLAACSKEDLDQPVDYTNLYVIKDDPSDPVKHRIWQIYEKYGAPVYFNDTIGKYYVKDDVYGNPYYRYELIDLNWSFYSNTSQSISYTCYYQTNPEHQMISLDFVEKFLSKISKPIQPYAIFLADSIGFYEKGKGYGSLYYALRFGSLSLASLQNCTETKKDSMINDLTKSLIKTKISKYTYEIGRFNSVCKSAWYDAKWKDDLGVVMNSSWGPSIFTEWAKQQLMQGSIWDRGWTEEQVEAERDRIRKLIGAFGFVNGSSYASSVFTPESTGQDLDTYMDEMLSCDRAEFTRRWGECPLVMRKYEILYNLLKDELDYEL